MKSLWALSQFVADSVTGMLVPVAADYAHSYLAPANPLPSNDASSEWGLVQLSSDPPQIAALQGDDRIVYCGTVWDTPPAMVMTVYSAYLLGTETLMGQVLSRLGNKFDPQFLPE